MTDTTMKVFEPQQALANFKAFQEMANYFQESGALPSSVKNPAQLVMLMQAGLDYWLTPTEAMSSLAFINGTISMFWTKVIQRVYDHWYLIDLKEELKEEIFEKEVEWKKKKFKKFVWFCEATLTKEDRTRTEKYTMEDAKNSGLLGKDNWTKYPKLMLRYRAIGNAVKFFCPEILGGIAIYEEMKDHYEKESSFEKITDDDILDWFDTEAVKIIDAEEAKKQEETMEKESEKVIIKEDKKEYIPGVRVKHKIFGDGVIDDARDDHFLVQFDDRKFWLKEIEWTATLTLI